MFNQVSGGSSIESAGGEAPAPLTMHISKQARSQGEMAVRTATDLLLEGLGSQESQRSVSQEIKVKPLSVNRGQSYLESPAIREFIGPSLDIEKLIRKRGEQWAKKADQQFSSAVSRLENCYGCSLSSLQQMPSHILRDAIAYDSVELIQFVCLAGLECPAMKSFPPFPDIAHTLHDLMYRSLIIGHVVDIDMVKALIQLFPPMISFAFDLAIKQENMELVNILFESGVSKEHIGQALVNAAHNLTLTAGEVVYTLLKVLLEADDASKKYVGEAFVEVVKQGSRIPRDMDASSKKMRDEDVPNDVIDVFVSKHLELIRENKEIVNILLKIVNAQPSLCDHYVGEALTEVAQIKGSEEMAKLLFAAGAGNHIHVGEALTKAGKIGNVDFVNAFFKSLS